MQTIKLNNRNFKKLENGKTTSIRLSDTDKVYRLGDALLLNVDTGQELPVIVKNIYQRAAYQLTQEEAERDGFHSVQELKNELAMCYTRVIKDFDPLTIIQFETGE